MVDWINYEPWDLDAPEPKPFEIDGVRLTMCCAACPEAYDADLDGTRIGYLRLRGGHFYAVYPDVGGEMVYETYLDDPWQGCFAPEERKVHIPLAVKALLARHKKVG